MVNKINGSDALEYFLKECYPQYSSDDLIKQDDPNIQKCIEDAIDALGIWLPVELYKNLPIISPFVKRDNSCRPLGNHKEDMWGTPNEEGYFRDDNSIIKGYPKSLLIKGTKFPFYNGNKIGNGFVTAHCWMCKNNNYNPWVNSFIPNLVWLPKKIAVLTDVEGSFAQQYVQFLSYCIYKENKDIKVNGTLQLIINECWNLLPKPALKPSNKKGDVNFFEYKLRMQKSRKLTINKVCEALCFCLEGKNLSKRVVCKKYTEGLPNVTEEHLKDLRLKLENYLNAIQ